MENRSAQEDNALDVSLLVFNNVKTLFFITLIGSLLALGLSFLLPKGYRAEVVLVPSTRLNSDSGMQLPGGLSGASSLMGLNLGGSNFDLSTLFGQIARRKSFAREILETEFTARDSSRVTLARFLNPDYTGKDNQTASLVKRFSQRLIRVRFDEKSGVTTIGMELSDPYMTYQVANVCAENLDTYYRSILHDKQFKMVNYLDEQLSASQGQLHEAEGKLLEFIENNRSTQGSPALQFELARLRRAVEIREEVFLNLSGQLEIVKFEYYRNMPSIIVIDEAVVPYTAARPNRPVILAVGIVLSLFLGLAFLFIREGRRRFRLHQLAGQD